MITMHSNHIQTICELKKIAEEKGYKFNFGTTFESRRFENVRGDDLFTSKRKIKIFNKLVSNCSVCGGLFSSETVWFEFVPIRKTEDDNRKYLTMVYSYDNGYIELEEDCLDEFNGLTNKERETLQEDMLSSELDDSPVINITSAPTKYSGMSGHSCYRADMALKFFADAICRKLKVEITQLSY